ncbi:MAG: NAD(+) synthase, partial [Clostridia bacterium]|nr:NAD(+) synthase [Clostridia bacterium]
MKHGFIKTATVSPELRVADTVYNAEKIIQAIRLANEENVSLLVFPELCVTGYTCADLFLQRSLLEAAKKAADTVVKATAGIEMLIFIGMPLCRENKVYDTAVAICNGEVLGIIPKTHLANYGESYEARWFAPAKNKELHDLYEWSAQEIVPFSPNLIFSSELMPEFSVGCEIGEDLMTVTPPSEAHAKAGANIIVNLSASAEIVGRAAKRRLAVTSASARTCTAYLYANAGCEESTTDGVFSGHSMIAENGKLLCERKPFETGMQTAVIDVFALEDEKMKKNTYPEHRAEDHLCATFLMARKETETPKYPKRPFIPTDKNEFEERAESIINIQA